MFLCICGKEFTDPQSFNGHKSNCEKHLINKYGSLEGWLSQRKTAKAKAAETVKTRNSEKRKIELQKWVSEKHTCAKCGKVMTEKYGSGRFCSRRCANSRKHSQDTKDKISKSLITLSDGTERLSTNHLKAKNKYENNPKYCITCNSKLPYEKRNNLTCCLKCQHEYQSVYMLDVYSERPISRCGTGKRGWYKGYWCQSSWELAYVIYCLDHNINIERNTRGFKYIFENKEHTYFPDFYHPDNDTYVKIKGWYNKKSKEKAKQFNESLLVYEFDKMKPILEYVETKYGKDFIQMYDVSYTNTKSE